MFRSRTPKENVSAEDLISDVKNGIMIHGRGSYSIDQQRYNFQFGGQTFWEIKNGKVVGMLKMSRINRARPISGAPATRSADSQLI